MGDCGVLIELSLSPALAAALSTPLTAPPDLSAAHRRSSQPLIAPEEQGP
jgi:hypothetical protein